MDKQNQVWGFYNNISNLFGEAIVALSGLTGIVLGGTPTIQSKV